MAHPPLRKRSGRAGGVRRGRGNVCEPIVAYWHTVKRSAFERPVVEGLAGSRIHHWA
jgi:hypothetical protein